MGSGNLLGIRLWLFPEVNLFIDDVLDPSFPRSADRAQTRSDRNGYRKGSQLTGPGADVSDIIEAGQKINARSDASSIG